MNKSDAKFSPFVKSEICWAMGSTGCKICTHAKDIKPNEKVCWRHHSQFAIRKEGEKMSKPTKFSFGKKYKLIEDFNDIVFGLIKKGTVLTFVGPNLGYAKFRMGWKDIGIKPKQAFKIMKEDSPGSNRGGEVSEHRKGER